MGSTAWLVVPQSFRFTSSSPAPPSRRRRCRQRIPRACAARGNEVIPDHAVSVAPVSLESLPYPGESVSLQLGTEQLRLLAPASLLNKPPRALLYLPSLEGHESRPGALLAVSSARPSGVYTATVDATAISRAQVERNVDDVTRVARVHDWAIWEYSARIKLAQAMSMATSIAEQTRKIRRQLGNAGAADDDSTWARLRATKADSYDTDLQMDEWEKTPQFVRETWCKRAELFSFAAVRYAGDSELAYSKMAAVWDGTDTLERVNFACELLIAAKAKAVAKLSLKNALGENAT